MTEPSAILQEEHEVIQHLLHVLSAMAKRLVRGETVVRADVDDALDVVVNFADKCHHAKEEKALFPVLARASPQEGAPLVRVLESEHDEARELVASLRRLAPLVEKGDPAARRDFVTTARSYVQLLSDHIDRENAALLPLTETAVSPEERASLAAEFERIEREETGAGLHEKYEGTIHRLADVYLHAAAHAH